MAVARALSVLAVSAAFATSAPARADSAIGFVHVSLRVDAACRAAFEPTFFGRGAAAPVISCNVDVPRRLTVIAPPPETARLEPVMYDGVEDERPVPVLQIDF